ncbi:hypothetical protein P280DRAFT_477494 [Massarina eburnea CBS 473.64]|uniref:Uncharacterized protein n=1 Tax=Massarina eburnea CBS 473.64 TaxID=1395130 RepID=A0A6A6S8N8_9PLEO|nr:hypothetical protein P280DRAFT_477494 [Massarina eburnea CBS 473.64]
MRYVARNCLLHPTSTPALRPLVPIQSSSTTVHHVLESNFNASQTLISNSSADTDVANSPAEFERYKKQPGVNVFGIHEPIADPGEVAQIEQSLAEQFDQQIQNNQVRFYKTDQKLSDAGGGLKVYFNGKKLDQKALLMGSLNIIANDIKAALAKDQQ